jgi:regulator of replication initiation timing
MWRQILSFIQTVLTLARDVEQIHQKLEKLNDQVHTLALTVERLQSRLDLLAQREEYERDKLAREIEQPKQLPPKPASKRGK